MLVAHWSYASIVRLWSILHLHMFQGEYQQWWLAAMPRHPALKEVIDLTLERLQNYKDNLDGLTMCASARNLFGDSLILYLIRNCKGLDILRTTGPFAFTEGVTRFIANTTYWRRVRILWPNGDGVFVYDYTGDHRAYGSPYFLHGARLIRNV